MVVYVCRVANIGHYSRLVPNSHCALVYNIVKLQVLASTSRVEGPGGSFDAGVVPPGKQEERVDPQTNAAQYTVSTFNVSY